MAPGRVERFALIGRIPVASYPTFAAAASVHSPLAWISGNGIGVGPNPNGPNPYSQDDVNDFENNFQYLPSIVRGDGGVLPFPSDAELKLLTPVADRELVPTDSQKAPAGTPIRSNGPIKHVFIIVKENRTYDQVFGDVKQGDGDPALTLFGANITPNEHALVQRFPLLDHVYADSQVSIDGHYITSSGEVPDYVVRNWPPNYAGRGRPLDFGAYEVAAPYEGTIFDRALKQGISFYNYGEAFGGLVPPSFFPDKDRTAAEAAQNVKVLAGSDVQLFGGGPAYQGGPSLPACYDSEDTIFNSFLAPYPDVFDSSLPAGAPAGSHSRYDCWLTRFQQQLAHNAVPALNYMVLPLDHTEGVAPGSAHPRCRRGRQRLGAGRDRRSDLALLDLGQLADPGDGGRRAGRPRSCRRPPDSGNGDQPVHAGRRRHPQPLRPAVVPADDGDHSRDEAGEPRRSAGRAPV